MRFQTKDGRFVTARTRAEAAALAAQYGFGPIVGAAPAPTKPAKAMTLAEARSLAARASDWPRCGQGWPSGAREREAASVLAEHGERFIP